MDKLWLRGGGRKRGAKKRKLREKYKEQMMVRKRGGKTQGKETCGED